MQSIAKEARRVGIALTSKGGGHVLLQGFFDSFQALIGNGICAGYDNIWDRKDGMEIGGPSQIFSHHGLLPIYDGAKSLIFVDFRDTTVWKEAQEGVIKEIGEKLKFKFITSDASESISGISSDSLDFILASNVLEHLANPLKALLVWKQLLRDNGYMVIIVPDKRLTFDHRRTVTTVEHFLRDYKCDTAETDTTHFDEIISLHDQKLDRPDESRNSFIARVLRNNENRTAHHHVFVPHNAMQLMREAGMMEVLVKVFLPFNIVMIFKKTGHSLTPQL